MQMWIVWLIILIVALVIEAATLGLSSVWIAFGALVALIMDLLGAPVLAQVIVMIAVSVVCFIICIIWIRPIIDSKRSKETIPTNADRLIGKEGIVIVSIDVDECKGQVKVMGQVWIAFAKKNIPEGKKVKVLGMSGVKLEVEPIASSEE